MARSTAYWAANLYPDPERPPRAGAPLRDLPPIAAAHFRMLRDGITDIENVVEKVKFVRPLWNWTWEYSMPVRRLCWLHVMDCGISGTFALSEDDERQLTGSTKLSAAILQSVRDGQRTGPVRWCWLDLGDRRSIEAFLGFMRRKAAWVAAHPADPRVFRRSNAG